jgi:hypothetical protein
MKCKAAVYSTLALLGASVAQANSGCDPAQLAALQSSERIVGSLRPDKPGLGRVFAFDGSEFTAGQSQWLRGQLNKTSRACARGDVAEADRLLAEVRELIKSHQRS